MPSKHPEYQMMSVEKLRANPKNARTHTKKQIKKIAKSIEKFQAINPIVCDSQGVLIAGHGRLEAAHLLEMKEFPCVLVDHLSEAEKRAYMLADNKIATESGWDDDLLSIELNYLNEMNFDLDLTGFEVSEVSPFIRKSGNKLEGEDDAPEPEKTAITQEGDVWQLGNHRLMCGDSTDTHSIYSLMDDARADMMLTDPPYNVDYEGKTPDKKKIKNDSMPDEKFREFLRDALTQGFDSMREGAAFYIWHADLESYNFRGAVRDCGEQVRSCLIWNKPSLVLGRSDYQWKHEPCLYGWKDGAAHYWNNDRKQTTVIDFIEKVVRNDVHPTIKPVALMEYCIENSTQEGESVLDIFGGSGSTLIACEKLGRVCYMMELDPIFVDVIIRRWQELSGGSAVRQSDNKSFNEIADGEKEAA